MDFGINFTVRTPAKQIMDVALEAEKNGLDFFLLTDHYMVPDGSSTEDCWTMLAAIAARTERIRLGTGVTPIPFRPPAILAKIIATVDHISEGRVSLGVGSGWGEAEFKAYSTWDEPKVRWAKMVEGLALMRQLWTSKEPFDFHGKYYQSTGGLLEPKPVQKPYPPLWFGGTGKSTLKLATQYADSWMPPGGGGGSWKVEQYEPIIKALRTDNKTGRRIKLRFNGSVPEIKENIETFSKMGFDGAFLVRLNYKDSIDGIRKLAKEVIPSYR